MGFTFLVTEFPVGTFLWGTTSPGEASQQTTFEGQEAHLFTPQEACRLLPDIKPKVRELVERKRIIVRLHREIERCNLLGFRTSEVADKAAQLDSLAEEMTRKFAELEDLGVQVKDLDLGWIDFPAERYGEAVMFCWRYGEPEVTFWHRSGEGFNKRRPLRLQIVQP